MSNDPTLPIREAAAAFEEVVAGTACNQSSFKTKKGSYLFIGPGAKGIGYKAMFKLKAHMDEARELAMSDPEHFEVGNTGWVTVRFQDELTFPKSLWERWLEDSYQVSLGKK